MNKTQIEIGKDEQGKGVFFNVAKLIKTRLLVCANSGGGKSWLLRRIIELLFGIMPTIIFDVEGEFATLREKFDFVLVGPGGETPADCRSAKLVILKLLELRASAVIDLSEMDVLERHRYIQIASEAAINAPKKFWRPTCFVFDEAHEVCPESGKGSSVAKAAVLAFATKGRKRQFLALFATQRLHKLAFDCRAELLNRLVGFTFEPDDLKVAASIFGVSGKEEVRAFNSKMRTMDEGYFFGFGRAICLETKLIKVGPVQTTHGVEESSSFAPPPAPKNIQALLPKLADLPQLAEEKAKTEEELRAEVKRLNQELRQAKSAAPVAQITAVAPKPVKIPILKGEHIQLIRDTAKKFDRIIKTNEDVIVEAREQYKLLNQLSGVLEIARQFAPSHGQPAHGYTVGKNVTVPPPATVIEKRKVETNENKPWEPTARSEWKEGQGDMGPGEIAVLTAIAQCPDGIAREHISVLTGYKVTSRKTYLARLRQRGYIDTDGDFVIALSAGKNALGPNFKPLPTGEELIEHYRKTLPEGERKVMNFALANGGELANDDALEAATNYKVTSRKTYIARLVARHILESAGRGRYRMTKGFSI